jgi:dienelactone hydrolase
MKTFQLIRLVAACLTALFIAPAIVMAQTNQTDVERWVAGAEFAPPFKVPTTLSAWKQKRKKIRTELWQLLGQLPPRPKVPDVKTLSVDDRGSYTVEKFSFDNGAGATVPGYLLRPKNVSGKAPAILFCHRHGGHYDLGKEELFETNHLPEVVGPALASRGYVVLCIDAYCFGERNGRGPDGAKERGTEGEWSAAKFQLWAGRSLWGMIVRDDLMALDYLASRPEVDAERIGVTGMSMGATRSWWLMALDDRIKTGVPVCCLTRGRNLIDNGLLSAHGIYYFVPGILTHFDAEAIVALIAPRPVFFQDGDEDPNAPVDGVRAIQAAVRPAYDLFGQATNFQSVIYPGQAHLYTPEMWAKTEAWLDGHLKNAPSK